MYHRTSRTFTEMSFQTVLKKRNLAAIPCTYPYSGIERNLTDYTMCGSYTTRVSHPVTLVTFCVSLVRSIPNTVAPCWALLFPATSLILGGHFVFYILTQFSSLTPVPLKLTQPVYLSRLSVQCHTSVRLKIFWNCGSVFAVASFTATDKFCISVCR